MVTGAEGIDCTRTKSVAIKVSDHPQAGSELDHHIPIPCSIGCLITDLESAVHGRGHQRR